MKVMRFSQDDKMHIPAVFASGTHISFFIFSMATLNTASYTHSVVLKCI